MTRTVQRKLALEPGRPTTTLLEREAQVERCIVAGLRIRGYVVQKSTHRYKRQTCPKCQTGFWPKGGYGADKAIADLFVRNPAWPISLWIQIEVKGTRTPLSKEQRAALDEGQFLVARCWEDAWAIVQRMEESVGR